MHASRMAGWLGALGHAAQIARLRVLESLLVLGGRHVIHHVAYITLVMRIYTKGPNN